MTKRISSWQTCTLVAICIFATKFQRLSGLLAQDFNRSAWIVMLAFLAIDILFCLLLLNVIKRLGDKTIFEVIKEKIGGFGLALFCLIIAIYYFFKITICYKGIHEFFANTLFDKLSWNYFSILLLIVLVFIIANGLNNMGRLSEVFAYIVLSCVVICLLLGLTTARFERLLPIWDLDIKRSFANSFKYTAWFGDYFMLIFLAGNIKIDKNLTKGVTISYLTSGLLVVASYIIFYAVNENMSGFQSLALSSITHYSLIGLGVGRLDWFLVLFMMISSIIASAFYGYAFIKSMVELFKLKFNYSTCIVGAIIIYVADIFLFNNIQSSIDMFKNYFSYYMLAINVVVTLFICLLTKGYGKEKEENKSRIKQKPKILGLNKFDAVGNNL